MQKTIIVVILNIIMVGMLRAQPDEAVLIDRYGAIRANMVRDICTLVGVSDAALLETIENNSLNSFKQKVKNDTLKRIVDKAKPLSGTDIDKYVICMRETRRDLLYAFCSYYPEKERNAEKQFDKYYQEIINVTNEFYPSNPDEQGTHKNTKQPSANLLATNTTSIFKAGTKRKETNTPNSNYLIGIIVGLVFAVAVVFVLRKRKKCVLKIRKVVDMMEDSGISQKKSSPQKNALASNMEQLQSDATEDKTEFENANDESEEIKTVCGGGSIAVDADEWIVVGTSVQGNGHVEMEVPCQDSHAYEYLSRGWGIAIVSDGAGSAKLSHKGSAAVVSRAIFHFKSLIIQEGWIEKNILPSDGEWMRLSYRVLKQVHGEICLLSQRMECEPKDLNATIIVVIHSPLGLLSVHVGDGTAGYKDLDGNWHTLITPHKGEEANQTIFMMSEFWNIPFYEMSGVMVPESIVLQKPVLAFTLMSDGCESTSWLCNQYNEETGKYYDPNVPYAKFFDSLIETLQSFREGDVPMEERKNKWFNFIKSGNKSFVKETDDKTMILATLYKKQE